MNKIPITTAIKTLEDARRLSVNSKGNPRSLPLVRFLDTAICDLKAKQAEPRTWQDYTLVEYMPLFFGGRG